MASTKPELVTSLESVHAVASFFDQITHELAPKDWSHEADIVKFARQHGIKVPSALDEFAIKLNTKPSRLSKGDVRHTIVVELPPRSTSRAKARQIGGCFDAKKGPITARICVDCSITWHSVKCTVTITIKFGF